MKYFKHMRKLTAGLLSGLVLLSTMTSAAFAESPTIGEAKGSSIQVIDYNLHTSELTGTENELSLRAERAITLFEGYKADSMGFQEANVHWMELLNNGLEEYACVGVGRENGTNDENSGEASPIFYLKDKYELVDSGTFWLSDTPDVPSIGWDAAYRRVCTWAVLRNKKTGETYAHVNTHLDHVGTTARTRGMQMVIEKIKEFNVPVVCTGDFKTAENSGIYNQMLASGFMNDTKKLADVVLNPGATMANYNVNANLDSGAAIDFIFAAQDSFQVQTYKVLRDRVNNKFISDHLGVYAELTFTASPDEYRAVYGTAELDGVQDGAYERAQEVAVNLDAGGNTATGATATVRTIYDKDYIYSFAHVTDSTVNSAATRPTKNNYGIDGVQFFYDFQNDGGSSWVSGQSGYFIADLVATDGLWSDGSTQIGRWAGGFGAFKGHSDKMDYRAVKTENGYNIEIRTALPDSLRSRWSAGEENIVIGAGFQVNDDSNDDGTRDNLCFSSTSIADAWLGPQQFGKMVLAGCPSQGDDIVISGSQYYVAVQGTPTVDGDYDEAYQNAPAIPVNKNGSNALVNDPGTATATVRVLYDDQYLYCYADVADAHVNNPATVAPNTNYGIDNVQVFFDFLNNDSATDTDSSYTYGKDNGVADHERGYMMLYANNKTPFATYGFGSDFCTNGSSFNYVSKIGGNGYQIEMRIKLSDSLKARLAAGASKTIIGIGFQVNDDANDDGTRDNVVFSDSALSYAWASPIYFQNLLLGKTGDQPTYPADKPADTVGKEVKNVAASNGAADGELVFSWTANAPYSGTVQIAKKSDMTGDEFPAASAQQVLAGISVSAEKGFYSNQATITGLDTDTEYVYRVGTKYAWSEVGTIRTDAASLNEAELVLTNKETGVIVTVPALSVPAGTVLTVEKITSGDDFAAASAIPGTDGLSALYRIRLIYQNSEVTPVNSVSVKLPVGDVSSPLLYRANADGQYGKNEATVQEGMLKISAVRELGFFAVMMEKTASNDVSSDTTSSETSSNPTSSDITSSDSGASSGAASENGGGFPNPGAESILPLAFVVCMLGACVAVTVKNRREHSAE